MRNSIKQTSICFIYLMDLAEETMYKIQPKSAKGLPRLMESFPCGSSSRYRSTSDTVIQSLHSTKKRRKANDDVMSEFGHELVYNMVFARFICFYS